MCLGRTLHLEMHHSSHTPHSMSHVWTPYVLCNNDKTCCSIFKLLFYLESGDFLPLSCKVKRNINPAIWSFSSTVDAQRNLAGSANQKVNDVVFLKVCTGTKVGVGGADKQSSSSSSPDTWPTFTAASHVTVLLREKAPFVCQCSEAGEGGRSLGWSSAQPQPLHPPSKEKKKKVGIEEKKQRPDFPPLPGVLLTHSVPASAHKHRLISGATTTLVIVCPAS